MAEPIPASTEPTVAGAAAAPVIEAPASPAAPQTLGDSLYPAPAEPPADPATPADPAVELPAGEAPPEPDAAKPPESEAPVVLAAADYKFTFPENISVDDAVMTDFREAAAEAKLPNESAQKLLDMHVKGVEQTVAKLQEAQVQQFRDTQADWTRQIDAMPEFQGAERERSLAVIGRVLDEFGSPEVREIFNLTGSGNNPHVVKMILSLANALVEGEPTSVGNPPTGAKQGRTFGQIFYPEPSS